MNKQINEMTIDDLNRYLGYFEGSQTVCFLANKKKIAVSMISNVVLEGESVLFSGNVAWVRIQGARPSEILSSLKAFADTLIKEKPTIAEQLQDSRQFSCVDFHSSDLTVNDVYILLDRAAIQGLDAIKIDITSRGFITRAYSVKASGISRKIEGTKFGVNAGIYSDPKEILGLIKFQAFIQLME